MRLDKANRNIYDKCAEPASQEWQHMRRILLSISLIVAAGTASAQAPPMGGLSQMYNQNVYNGYYFNQRALYYGQLCLQKLQQLRASGYYGPADCGANAATLQNSARNLQGAYDRFNQSGWYHNEVMNNAYGNWDRGALRGQYPLYHWCWYGGQYVRC